MFGRNEAMDRAFGAYLYVTDLRKAGMTQKEIAAKLGISVSRVNQICNRYAGYKAKHWQRMFGMGRDEAGKLIRYADSIARSQK